MLFSDSHSPVRWWWWQHCRSGGHSLVKSSDPVEALILHWICHMVVFQVPRTAQVQVGMLSTSHRAGSFTME